MQRRLNAQSGIYVVTEGIYGVAMGMYSFVLNLFLLDVGLSPAQIGILTGLGIVIKGVLALPLSLLAKRTGRKNMYAYGVFIIGCAIPLYALTDNFTLLLLIASAIAVGLLMVEVTEVQVMYGVCDSDSQRVTVYSWAFATFALSSALGVFAAGQLPRLLTGDFWRYKGTLVLAGIITIVVAVLRYTKLHNDLQSPADTRLSTEGHPLHTSRRLPDRRFVLLMVWTVLHGVVSGIISPYSSLIIKFRTSFSDTDISYVLSAGLAFSFLFSAVTPMVQRNMYSHRTYSAVYCVCMGVCLLLAGDFSVPLFILLFLLNSGMEVMCKNMVDSVIYLLLPDGQRDVFSGMRSLVRGLAGSVTAFVTASIIQMGRLHWIFIFSLIFTAAALLFFLTFIVPILKSQRISEDNVNV